MPVTMDITTTATYLKVSRARVYKLLQEGKLKSRRIAGKMRVNVVDAEEWVKSGRQATGWTKGRPWSEQNRLARKSNTKGE